MRGVFGARIRVCVARGVERPPSLGDLELPPA